MFVKVCGITTEDDGLLAVAMGADSVSFMFAPSTRQIAPTRAGDIAKRLPAEVLTLGVFRNESRERVVQIVNRHGLGGAQLHGHESPEDTAWISERVPRVLKAFVAGSPGLDDAHRWKTNPILVDGVRPGSGETYDWSQIRSAPPDLHVMMAGGLGPDNVAEAILAVRPWGVDASSGLEKSPGRKDPVKVRDFIREARRAAEEVAALPPLPPLSPLSAVGEATHDGAASAETADGELFDWRVDG